MKKRVVVTGGSAITPIGNSWQEIEARLRAGKNGIVYMEDWNKYAKMNTKLAGPVSFENPGFTRKQLRGMGRVSLLACTTAEEALVMAGLKDDPELGNGRCGVA